MPVTKPPKSRARELVRDLNLYEDDAVGRFRAALDELATRASARVQSKLVQKLDFADDGSIKVTAGNQRVLRSIPQAFEREMKALGYPQLVDAFVEQFPGQFRFVQQSFDLISEKIRRPLGDVVAKIRAGDRKALESQMIGASTSLGELSGRWGELARRRALLGISGLDRASLAELIAERFQRLPGEAATLADTTMATFFRSAIDAAADAVEADDEAKLLWVYEGPLDKLTRPFCGRLLAQNRPRTREEIRKLDNGQIPDAFRSGGGYNCRHQWIVVVDEEETIEPRKKQPSLAARQRPAAENQPV